MADENADAPPEPIPISVPPDFPVTWDHPDEERVPWELDPMHFPEALPVLEGQIWCCVSDEGMNPAFEEYEMPIRAMNKVINGYIYSAMVPAVAPEEMEAQGERSQEQVGMRLARLEESWNEEWLPEIKEHLAFWDAFDLQGATTEDLRAHFEVTLERANRLWLIHFQIVTPVYMAMGLFDDLYHELFEDEGTFDSYQLLGGFDNKTLEVNRALWDLSRRAAEVPEVRRVLEEKASAEVVAALGESVAGQAFLGELRAFLETCGQRGPTWSLSQPSWIEDPQPVILNLQDYVVQTERDPRIQQATMVGEREQAVAAARQRLQGYPQQAVEQFEFLLKASQMAIVLTEDHGYWIDFNSMYRVRRVIMELGRRFTEVGVLAEADDIFHLELDEVSRAAIDLPEGDLRAQVEERRATLAHFQSVSPPRRLGADYGPPPDNALTRSFGKFFVLPPEPQDEEGILKGNAGSPGKVQGPARVIRSLEQAEALQQGDVLVAETTSPPWTPLFGTAAAIVTDTGGILSHCAVVAREYRIPAVVGTGAATAAISDGQIVEVDGDNGIVKIVG